MQNQLDDDAVSNLIGYFAERLNLVFSYFFCVTEFEEDEDFTADDFNNARAWSLQTIRDACLNTTLIALRDLDDVLTPRTAKTKPDDFRLSDLGFTDNLSFLSPTERVEINKRIAHSTHVGAVPLSQRWKVFDLVSRCTPRCLQFLDWIADGKGPDPVLSQFNAIFIRTRTRKIFDYFAEKVRQQRTHANTAPDPR
jgi:hypothetical protein